LDVKLVIFGLTISSSWGNGHATVWRALCQALARRGHRVSFFERDVPYYASHRDLYDIPCGKLTLYSDWAAVLAQAERDLADADVGMVTSYCPDGVAATELVLGSRALRVFYDLDTPVTLEQLERGREVAYIGPLGLRDFDLVLSFTGGKALETLQTRLGARRVKPLYGSVDPDIHCRVPPVAQYRADLSYIGTYAEDRQETLEALFLKPARHLPDRRFLIAGAQYPPAFPWLANIFFVRHIAPPDHPALYSSSRLTLNVTRRAMVTMGYCPSGRLFEAAACATPILSDWWEGLDQFFEPSREILVTHGTDEALQALQLSDHELQRVAHCAHIRVLEEHSAERRAQQLEQALASVSRCEPVSQRSEIRSQRTKNPGFRISDF
jgi:spore maturation protein CgeB